MSLQQTEFLFTGAVLSGLINSFAGGGAFLTLPLLIKMGLAPTVANMTASVATGPGLALSAWGLRDKLQNPKFPWQKVLWIVSLSSLLGSVLIRISSDQFFSSLMPFLILGATLFFIYGTWFLKRSQADGDHPLSRKTVCALALVGVYGGYWGGGMGLMFVSVLTVAGWANLQEMNALKVLLMAAINILGAVIFIQGGFVSWPHAAIVCLGAALGGVLGAKWIAKVSVNAMKILVAVYAVALSLYYLFASV